MEATNKWVKVKVRLTDSRGQELRPGAEVHLTELLPLTRTEGANERGGSETLRRDPRVTPRAVVPAAAAARGEIRKITNRGPDERVHGFWGASG